MSQMGSRPMVAAMNGGNMMQAAGGQQAAIGGSARPTMGPAPMSGGS